MRLVKTPDEIALMQRAATIAAAAHRDAQHLVKPGLYEYQIEAAIDRRFRTMGATGPAYPTIVASGDNATIVPLSQPRDKLRDQNTDKGYQCDGYCGLYLSLPLWIVAFWPGLIPALWRRIVKPNVELRG